ncbi:hypothetical protein DIPPA_19445 [Diplonema papillatum]|nr:hypothetical protein DIPPA_19445 [Diplonema papillatum]
MVASLTHRRSSVPESPGGPGGPESPLREITLLPDAHTAMKKMASRTEKTQRMTVLLGFAVVIAAVLYCITLVRQELLAQEISEATQRIQKDLNSIKDTQKLQSIAISRIGSMLTQMQEKAAG